MFFLLISVAAITATPLLAALVVTAASLREDYDQSLAGRAPGPITAAARWLLRARVGTGTSRPRRLRISRVLARRSLRREWTTRPEPPGPRSASGRPIPRPRRAVDDSQYPLGRDGVHPDGVHPDGADHAGSVPRW